MVEKLGELCFGHLRRHRTVAVREYLLEVPAGVPRKVDSRPRPALGILADQHLASL